MQLVRLLERILTGAARPFSPLSRSVLVVAILTFLAGATFFKSAIAAPVNIDEMSWVDRSLKPLWGPPYDDLDFFYAVHHPSLSRIVYRTVLHAQGVYEVERPLVDYHKAPQWNFDRGAFPPYGVETALRYVNVAFLCGMAAFVYLGLRRILGNRALALAGCLPIFFNVPINNGACGYLGTDSMLLFWLAAFWYAWLLARGRGFFATLGLAVVGGLLVSTKVNGAFALVAAAAYFAASSRGYKRVVLPATLLVVPAAIFYALDPIYHGGGAGRVIGVMHETVRIMLALKAQTLSREWAQYARLDLLKESFPYWFFWLPALAVIVSARREKWFWPTAAWAGANVVLNWVLIYVPFLRYAAPMSMSFLVLFGATGLRLVADTYREATGADAGGSGAGGGRP